MEEGLEAVGEAPHVVKARCLKELPRRAAPQNGKRHPLNGFPQTWPTQCQEFLKELDCRCSGSPKLGPWDDAKAFLASFEQVAEACQWPRKEWVARLLPALSGEAKVAFGNLEAGDREDYEKVKVAILRKEACGMEALRRHFRRYRCQEVEDPRSVYGHLRELCHQWLKPERHTKEQILELLILEQFLAILPQGIQSRIKSWDAGTDAETVAEVEFLMGAQGDKNWEWQVRQNLGLNRLAQYQARGSSQSEFWLPAGSANQLSPHVFPVNSQHHGVFLQTLTQLCSRAGMGKLQPSRCFGLQLPQFLTAGRLFRVG
uniref:SCAN box domain-containing protein n=1 Tax=Anolis carolinensis TaxID=28377 RepID=A0A803TYS7_ANOCA